MSGVREGVKCTWTPVSTMVPVRGSNACLGGTKFELYNRAFTFYWMVTSGRLKRFGTYGSISVWGWIQPAIMYRIVVRRRWRWYGCCRVMSEGRTRWLCVTFVPGRCGVVMRGECGFYILFSRIKGWKNVSVDALIPIPWSTRLRWRGSRGHRSVREVCI